MNDVVRNRLIGALSHIGHAIDIAKSQEEKGQVLFAVVTKYEDGTGSMVASFEAEPFFNDVCKVLGFDSPEVMLEHMLAIKNG